MNHRWIFALVLLVAACGCSFHTEPHPDPRGVVIPISEVPEAAMKEFQRHGSEAELKSIERIGDGALFRFEVGSGSTLLIDADGQFHGGMI